MSVRLRSVLASMPAYVPGRTVPDALKLASNETSYPPLPAITERIARIGAQANRYPDSFSVQLREALAERAGLDRGQVVVGNGSVALCQQVVQIVADAGDEVLFPWRSFEAYPIVSAVAGARAVPVPIKADQSFDMDALAAAVTDRTRVVFVCNPNNPTGTAVRRAAMDAFLDRVPADVLVVLDEAYFEFIDDPDVPDGTTYLDRSNILVLRTFSKAYGLAGLRVGYGFAADPRVADALRQTQIPFAVSQIAQQAALAGLEPDTEKQLLARVAEVVSERGRVERELAALGYDATPSQANFVWLALGERAVDWGQACEDHGVITRIYPGSGARITIGTGAENDRFLAAAAAIVPASRVPAR